jgi:uncharacterized membrane protein YfcA
LQRARGIAMTDLPPVADIAIYLLLGAGAGWLAGLLGIGGGLIIVATLAWLLPARGVPLEATMQVALGTALSTIVFTSLSSTRAHWMRGSVRWPLVAWLAPGLVVGASFGAVLATWLPSRMLAVIVAVYCLLSAWQLAYGRTRAATDRADQVGRALLAIAGGVIGIVSAIVGIGGGSMTVPLLVWRGVAPVQAVGTSAACGFAIAIASAAGYALAPRAADVALPTGMLGFIFWPAAMAMALASILTAPFGAATAHRLSPIRLRQVFAIFLVAIALLMAIAALRG